MQFKAPKEKIERCIAIAESIISSKPQMNILTNILLETEGENINVTSTDLEVGIRTSFTASIESEGSITINGAKFLGIVRQLPDEDIVFSVEQNNDIKIYSDNSSVKARYTMRGIPKENFPAVPVTSSEGNVFSIPQAVLKEMIRKTIFSISFENSRQYLNGIFFEGEQQILRLVSTDGRRLAYIERSFPDVNDLSMRSIVPQKVLSELGKYLSDEGMININFSDNQVFFSFNNIHFVSILIDGNFPNYHQVIPKKQEKFAVVERKTFVEALNRSSLLVDERFNQVKLDFSENHILLSINNSELGSFREELGVEYKGEPLEIAFNHRYLKDYFKETQSESFSMEMNTPLSPVAFKTGEDESYLYIVMPMKVSG